MSNIIYLTLLIQSFWIRIVMFSVCLHIIIIAIVIVNTISIVIVIIIIVVVVDTNAQST